MGGPIVEPLVVERPIVNRSMVERPIVATLRFVASHPCGALRLRLPEPAAGCTAACAAIALDDCDELLQALDDWLQAALDWRWEEADPSPCPTDARADWVPRGEVTDRPVREPGRADADVGASAGIVHVRLTAPWPLLRSAGPPPPELARHLRWHEAPALLTLSRLSLDPDEQAAIEPGGAVLLPDSMQADWIGWLRLPREAPGQDLRVPLGSQPHDRSTSAPPPRPAFSFAGAGQPCEVRLASAELLPADLLAGWRQPAPGLGELLDRPAELWLGQPEMTTAAGAPAQPRRLAQGRLIPWGQGWAMLVDRLQ